MFNSRSDASHTALISSERQFKHDQSCTRCLIQWFKMQHESFFCLFSFCFYQRHQTFVWIRASETAGFYSNEAAVWSLIDQFILAFSRSWFSKSAIGPAWMEWKFDHFFHILIELFCMQQGGKMASTVAWHLQFQGFGSLGLCESCLHVLLCAWCPPSGAPVSKFQASVTVPRHAE